MLLQWEGPDLVAVDRKSPLTRVRLPGQGVKDVWEWRYDAKRCGMDEKSVEVTRLGERIVEVEVGEESEGEEAQQAEREAAAEAEGREVKEVEVEVGETKTALVDAEENRRTLTTDGTNCKTRKPHWAMDNQRSQSRGLRTRRRRQT